MTRTFPILLLVWPWTALAQEPVAATQPVPDTPTTLGEVARRVLEVHPTVEAARAAAEGAEAGLRAARGDRLPALALEASAVHFQEPMLATPIHGFDPSSLPDFDETLVQGGLGLSYTLFDGGRRGARIAEAGALAGVGTARVRDVEAELIQRAVEAFVVAVTAAQAVEVQDQYRAALAAEAARAEREVEAGSAPRLVLLRARAELARADADREVAGHRQALAFATLARLLAVPVESLSPFVFDDVLVDAPAPDDLDVRRAPGVAETFEEARSAEAELSAARATWLPEVRLTGGWNVFAGARTDAVAEWQAGIRVAYPIFTGGARSSRIDAASARVRAARARVDAARDAATEAADRARLAEAEAHARTDALLAARAARVEVVRVERLALDEGAGVQAELLRSEADLRQLDLALADARWSALLARVRWARATGRLTPAWLETLSPEGS